MAEKHSQDGFGECSGPGDNMDYAMTTISPPGRKPLENDSMSDDDDFSDEFSLVDSDDERRFDFNRYSPHNSIQVIPNFLALKRMLRCKINFSPQKNYIIGDL